MKRINLLQLLLPLLVLLACEKDENLSQGNSISNIFGSSSGRTLYKVPVGYGYNYINKNGDIEFENTFYIARDFHNGFAAFGERLENEETTTYDEILGTLTQSYTSQTGGIINGQYRDFYGKYGEDPYGNSLPSNCIYIDNYTGNELSDYNNGDIIESEYRTFINIYGYNNNESYYTLDDEQITSGSPYMYGANYITTPYYTKETTNDIIKYGYINTKGEIVIPAEYDFAYPFYADGIALVTNESSDNENGYYFITEKGEKISNDSYYSAQKFSDGLAPVKYNYGGNYIYIDKDGLPAITKGYENAEPFFDGLAAVENNNYWGFINKNGEEVVPLRFGATSGIYTNNLIAVSDEFDRDAKWYYVDNNGKTAFNENLKFDNAEPFFDGLAAVEIGDRWRFINTNGEYEFTKSFDQTDGFSEGLAAVRDDNELWGYINKKGEYTIISQYLSANEFTNGIAEVIFTDENWGYIDKNGQEIWRSSEPSNIYYRNKSRSISSDDKSNRKKYIERATRLK